MTYYEEEYPMKFDERHYLNTLEDKQKDLDEARQIIQALARLIAGLEHLPAVPAELQERAEKFGADWSR